VVFVPAVTLLSTSRTRIVPCILHIVRHGGDRECYDEYTYRERVEPKAIKIARVRKVIADNAMDCPMQNTINTLPDRWRELTIKQTRAENNEENLEFALKDLMAPTFMNDGDEVVVCNKDPEEADRTYRPLSTYLDVRDEMLGVLADLFFKKAIWDRDELLGALKNYSSESVAYTLQQAIKTGFHFKDSFGRPALLESKGDLYALAPIYDPNTTMVERTTVPPGTKRVPLVEPEERKEEAPVEVEPSILDTKREEFVFPGNAKERFSREVLNSYVFDHLLTDEERKNYLRGRPRGLFLDRLYVNGEVTVLGHENTIPEELSPSNLTAYNAWSKILVDEFIANKDRLYGTVASNGKFAFSKVEVGEDGVARRFMQRQKQYRPIVCGTGAHQNIEVIKAFARTIDPDGSGIHPTVVTNENACIYAELLARREAEKEILARQEGRPYTGRCFWLTPQQTSVLFDSPENRKAFADTFPKK